MTEVVPAMPEPTAVLPKPAIVLVLARALALLADEPLAVAMNSFPLQTTTILTLTAIETQKSETHRLSTDYNHPSTLLCDVVVPPHLHSM